MKKYLLLPLICYFSMPIFGLGVDRTPENIRNKRKSKEYHLYTTRVSWAEAVEQCESKGMKLVSILTKEENDNVVSNIREAGQGRIGFWISANRIDDSETYHWSDGKPITFTDWENGKPDKRVIDGEEEKCIEIKGFNILKWNDNFCSHKLFYICEN